MLALDTEIKDYCITMSKRTKTTKMTPAQLWAAEDLLASLDARIGRESRAVSEVLEVEGTVSGVWFELSQTKAVELVVAEHLTLQAMLLCELLGVDCIDRCGNGSISHTERWHRFTGRPPMRDGPGRPRTLHLGGKQANSARLLVDIDRPLSRTEIAKLASLNRGAVNRQIQRLLEVGLLTEDDGAILATDRVALALAISEEYTNELHHLWCSMEDIDEAGYPLALSGDVYSHRLAPTPPTAFPDGGDIELWIVVPGHDWAFARGRINPNWELLPREPACPVQRFLDILAIEPVNHALLEPCWEELKAHLSDGGTNDE